VLISSLCEKITVRKQPFIGKSLQRSALDNNATRASLVRRVALGRAVFPEEHMPNVTDRLRQEVCPFFFRSKQDQIDEALPDLRHQLRQIGRRVLFDVVPHDIIDVAVQAIRFLLFHVTSPSNARTQAGGLKWPDSFGNLRVQP
jgi:hypothetical protein